MLVRTFRPLFCLPVAPRHLITVALLGGAVKIEELGEGSRDVGECTRLVVPQVLYGLSVESLWDGDGWDGGEERGGGWRTSSFLFPGCLHGLARLVAELGRVSTRETETTKSAIPLHPSLPPHPKLSADNPWRTWGPWIHSSPWEGFPECQGTQDPWLSQGPVATTCCGFQAPLGAWPKPRPGSSSLGCPPMATSHLLALRS